MKKIFTLALIGAVALMSCRPSSVETPVGKPDGTPDGSGTLALSVGNDTEFTTIVTTKAGGGVIDYTNVDDYDVIIDGPTHKEMKFSELAGNVVELSSGSYTVTVTSPATEPAAFNQPIYRAFSNFEIRAGEVTPLDLVCTPYNCMVTLELTDNFKKELATYEVVINNGLGSLTWTKDSSQDMFAQNLAGYFLPRGLEIKVKGHRSIDNTEATAIHYIENPQAAEHHIIKLDAKVTGQIGGIDISIQTDFNEKHGSIEVGDLEESYVDRPDFPGNGGEDEDDPVESTTPSVVWAANPYFDPIEITTTTEVSMVIKAPEGFKTFVVEVSDNFKAAIKVFTQSDVDYIDLINHADTWGILGLPVGDAIKGQTSVTFELTPFISTLCQAAGGMTVDFILKAGDVNDDYALIDDDFPVVTMIVPN